MYKIHSWQSFTWKLILKAFTNNHPIYFLLITSIYLPTCEILVSDAFILNQNTLPHCAVINPTPPWKWSTLYSTINLKISLKGRHKIKHCHLYAPTTCIRINQWKVHWSPCYIYWRFFVSGYSISQCTFTEWNNYLSSNVLHIGSWTLHNR